MFQITDKQFGANSYGPQHHFHNWPMLYILENGRKAYIGESNDVTTRMSQHKNTRDKKKKDKTLLSLECVTVLADKNFRTAEDKLKYCEKELGLKEPEILIEKIKLNTLFKINGSTE